MELVRPAREHLPSYVAALRRGWSPDHLRPEVADEELARIEADAEGFLASLENIAGGGTVTLPDGSQAQRLPGYRRWMWDGEFVGSINLRWQPGMPALPPHMLGHIGYAVVPWKSGRGHATRALGLLLSDARASSLPWVELTCDADNAASRRVIEANGGTWVEDFSKPAAFGGKASVRYRIVLTP